jgi:hypothetical protein
LQGTAFVGRLLFVCVGFFALTLGACSVGGQYGGGPTEAGSSGSASSKSGYTCDLADRSKAATDFFPWPPPKGSGEVDLTPDVYKHFKNSAVLADVAEFLRTRLAETSNGQTLYYYTIPTGDGFAAVARLTAIDDQGRALEKAPLEEPHGWLDWIGKKLGPHHHHPKGHFRLVVFFVVPPSVANPMRGSLR